MKRYIRTKDGNVYGSDRYAYTWTTPKFIGLGVSVNEHILIPKSLIEKQSDKLTCLCDKYIGLEEDGTPHVFAYECDLSDLIRNAERKSGRKVTGYGAIWIKGERGEPVLKSVAKMNEEGEFILL